jgi:hypothetical protein
MLYQIAKIECCSLENVHFFTLLMWVDGLFQPEFSKTQANHPAIFPSL